MTRVLVLAFALCAAISACEGTPPMTPTAPSTPLVPPASRFIRLSGDLDFGSVEVGGWASNREFQVCNDDGLSPLMIYEITGPKGFSVGFWDVETVGRGECLSIWASFEPMELVRYAGTVAVITDHGTATFQVSGTGTRPPAPRTAFGKGRYLVGIGVAPGRYYSDPDGECVWSRTPSHGDLGAYVETWFDPGQWIADILPSDAVFESEEGCGWWDQRAPAVADETRISPGMWDVGAQVRPGRYRANANAGCWWRRLRHFEGTPADIIASGSVQSAGRVFVEVQSSDAGFMASEACGKWTRTN